METNFTIIADKYTTTSIIQQSASEKLIDLLGIKNQDCILDVGCGTGKITQKLAQISANEVIGIDPSDGMIKKAKQENKNPNIQFIHSGAESLNYSEHFDIIFCNSVMQWFKDLDLVLGNFNKALKSGGKVGIQAPATSNYSPNFIKAIRKVSKDSKTSETFSNFKNPWLFFESEQEYKVAFERNGFETEICKLETIQSLYKLEDVLKIFSSGAAAGYLNKDYYDVEINEKYIKNFNSIVKEEFKVQADIDGYVNLVFNRVYIVARKL